MSRGRKLKVGDVVTLKGEAMCDGPFLMTVEVAPARASHMSRYGVVWIKVSGELERAEFFRGVLHLWTAADAEK